MNHYPQAPLSIGKVLDAGFSMYRAVLKPILPLSLILGLVSQMPQLLPYLMVGAMDPAAGIGAGIGPGLIVGFFVWFVVYLGLYNGWIMSMDSLGRGGAALGVGAAISAGLPKLLSVIGAMILFIIALLVGSALLVIPGLILMFSLFFFWYLILLENKGALESLKASHNLVWGNWWRTVTVITVGGVIYFVAIILVVGIAGANVGISALGGPTPEQAAAGPGVAGLVVFTLQVVLNALLLPMWNSLMLVLFRDLQLRKSGADLAARAAAA